MIYSTFSDSSGFAHKKSMLITNLTITGEIDGKFFESQVLPEVKEITQRLFQQEKVRMFNVTGLKDVLSEVKKPQKGHKISGKRLSNTL